MKKSQLFVLFLCLPLWITLSCEDTGPGSQSKEIIQGAKEQVNIEWPSLADSPWPMFLHDPQGTNRSHLSGPQLGEIAFTVSNPHGIYGSYAIDEDDLIYFVTTHGENTPGLVAMDTSGNLLWVSKLGTPIYYKNMAAPTLTSDGSIYVPVAHKVFAYNKDGSQRWVYDAGDNLSIAIVPDREGNLYFNTYEKDLISITSEGTLRWRISFPDGLANSHSTGVFSPDGSTLYVYGRENIHAVSTEGEIKWSFKTNLTFYAIVDNDGNVFIGNNQITSLSPEGEVNWVLDRGVAKSYAPTLTQNGNLIYYLSDGMISVNSSNGHLNWEINQRGATDPVSDVNSGIYFAVGTKIIHVSPEGEIVWEVEGPGPNGYVIWPLISGNNRCYFPVKGVYSMQLVAVK